MSLDVSLVNKKISLSSGIFIRENGRRIEITRQEWNERYPDRQPIISVEYDDSDEVYSANITHNLNTMAYKAGIYVALWRPKEAGWKYAKDIIPILKDGIIRLLKYADYYKQFNARNGWGLYQDFIPFVRNYLEACVLNSEAEIYISR